MMDLRKIATAALGRARNSVTLSKNADAKDFNIGTLDRISGLGLNGPTRKIENVVKDMPIGPALTHGGTFGLTLAGAAIPGVGTAVGPLGAMALSMIPPVGAVYHGVPQLVAHGVQNEMYDGSQLPAGTRINYDKNRIEYPKTTAKELYSAYMRRPLRIDNAAETLRTRHANFKKRYPGVTVPTTFTGFGGTYQLQED